MVQKEQSGRWDVQGLLAMQHPPGLCPSLQGEADQTQGEQVARWREECPLVVEPATITTVLLRKGAVQFFLQSMCSAYWQ